MNFKNESDFTRKWCDLLQRCNCKTTAFVASEMQEPGIPDRRVWGKDIRGVWCEMKRNDGRLSTAQRNWILEVQRRGDLCLVVRVYDNDQRISFEKVMEDNTHPVTLFTALMPTQPVEARDQLVQAIGLVETKYASTNDQSQSSNAMQPNITN